MDIRKEIENVRSEYAKAQQNIVNIQSYMQQCVGKLSVLERLQKEQEQGVEEQIELPNE